MGAVVRRGCAAVASGALTLAAALGVACLLMTVVAPLVGIRPLIFLSGSMSPTIPAGSLALTRTIDAAEIRVGDIVTVPSEGAYLTHRVVKVTHHGGKAAVLLRGDGNKVADDAVHEVTAVLKSEIWVPHAGTVVAWFSHAPGVYVLAGWVALVLGTLRRRRSSIGAPPTYGGGRPKLVLAAARRTGWGRGLTVAPPRGARLASVAAVVTATLAAPTPAIAAWADSAEITGTALDTVTPTKPVAYCGPTTATSVTVTWSPRAGATHYVLKYAGLGDPKYVTVTADVTSYSFTGDGRFSLYVRYGSDTWVSVYSNEVAYKTSDGKCTAFA